MRNYRDYAGELSYGDERPATTSGYNRPGSAHRSNSQKGLHNLNEESSGLAKTYGKGQTLGGGEKRLHLGRGKNNRDNEELSSLSGFTASDREEEEEEEHEDHNEIKWSMAPKIQNKNKKNKYADSDEEEEEERDIVLKPQNDLQERFREHDMMRRKGEQERQEQKILAQRNAELLNAQNSQTIPLKRPNSSHGALRTSTNMSRTFLNNQKENMSHTQNRPQTSYNNRHHQGEEEAEFEERKPVTFKPIYTKTIRETLINKKVYNYKDKNFKTIAKKSDPVSRINAFKNEWNKTKFLKANSQKKEGRKLNLAERNETSKPDFIFHRYKSKYNMD